MIFRKNKKLIEYKEIVKELEGLREKYDLLFKEIEVIKKEQEFSFQKIGLVRFNPFPGIGGDYSFSLAIANKKNNGVLITSFYTREGSSIYSKIIKDGKTDHSLIEEEKRALEKVVEAPSSKKKRIWKKKTKK